MMSDGPQAPDRDSISQRPSKKLILRREFLVFAGFALLTIVMTWPWVLQLRDAVSDPGDPYLNSWILWWDYHQTFHDPFKLFHANIFYPYRYTLAFSEHNYGIAVLFFPLFALGVRPLTIQGIATLVGFAFCGYGMFRLARTLTGCTGGAVVAGIIFAFIPYRFGQLPHLNYVFAGWIPMLLEALVLFARQRTWRRASWLGLVFLMNGLTCVHWFVLTLIPLGLSALLFLFRDRLWRDRQFWLRGLVAIGGAALLLLPFLLPYSRAAQLYGFVRSAEEARLYSAEFFSWVVGDGRSRLWHTLNAAGRIGQTSVFPEKELFPGVLSPLLALGAIILVRRSRAGGNFVRNFVTDRSEAFWLGIIWTVIGFFGSLGMNFPFHRILFYYLPLFRSIRVPARWAMICYLGLALLAALGAKQLNELVTSRWPRFRPAILFTALAILLLFDQRAAPLILVHGAVDPDQLTLKLKQTPMNGGIVELPSSSAQDNYLYVLRAADHAKPLVTAVSGFSPPIQNQIERLTKEGTVPDVFMDLLESIPCSYLIVHNRLLNTERQVGLELFAGRQIAAGRLRFVGDFDYNYLYVVVKTEPGVSGEAKLPDLVRSAAQPSSPHSADLKEGAANAIDDPEFFTRMQYLGFLGREPDSGGLAFWAEKIKACRNAPDCVDRERVAITASFFDTREFKDTSSFVYRVYKVALGRAPDYQEFVGDRTRLSQAGQMSFIDALVKRREFSRLWPANLPAEDFVDGLIRKIDSTSGVPLGDQRQQLINQLKSDGNRANVVRALAENPAFSEAEQNRAFVMIQYFAYFKRRPDAEGYDFWVNALNRDPANAKIDMVHTFINSKEYRAQFSKSGTKP